MSLRKKVSWQLKIAAKLILSRLPFSYEQWSKIGLFRHGEMDSFDYAWGVLKGHVKQMSSERKNLWYGLELGPGDGILSALLAPALGCTGLSLLDSGDYADKDINKYKRQINGHKQKFHQYSLPDYSNCLSTDEMLESAGGSYYTKGLASLKILKDNSFDIIYSQAVLEHVRRNEFSETMQHCRRLLKSDGVMSHVVDFKDHLGGNLNNLRFSSSLWEQEWFAVKSNFYTNRLRFSEIVKICEESGFEVKVVYISHYDTIPIKRNLLSKEFTHLSDEDLSVSETHLVMQSK
jgi:predicted SAM-dependent methyltransferase